jgi:hypothetical protein
MIPDTGEVEWLKGRQRGLTAANASCSFS